MSQKYRIARAIAQWRHLNDYSGQSIKQIFAKRSLGNSCLQILVRGTDNAHVNRNLRSSAQPLDGSFLQET